MTFLGEPLRSTRTTATTGAGARVPRGAEVAPVRTPTGRRVARFGTRVLPFVVDRLLALGLFTLGVLAFDPAHPAALRLPALVLVWCGPWLLVDVVVPALTGTSPGKALLGLELVRYVDGARPSWGSLLGRWAAATGLTLLPFGAAVDHLRALQHHRLATLHDLAAGTAVVHRCARSTSAG